MGHSQDFVVPPQSWDNIRDRAQSLRQRFGLNQQPYFPIIEFIEKVLDQRMGFVRFEVGDYHEMSEAEGFTCPDGEFIQLREDVYEGACRGDGRARFTAAHELGHLIMHTRIKLMRAPIGQNIVSYRLAEPQANRFAAELLMPEGFVTYSDTAETIMERHGVSCEAAENRIQYLRKKGRL